MFAAISRHGAADTYSMKDYWPIVDKVSLTYLRQINDTSAKKEIHYQISGPLSVGAFDAVYSMKDIQSANRWSDWQMEWTDQYLILAQYEDSSKVKRTYNDPLELLPIVLNTDGVNQGIGNGGIYFTADSSGSETVRLVAAKIETITVPAGEYVTLHITLERNWQEQSAWYGSETLDFWFGKNIGPIRRHRVYVTHDPSTTAPIAGSQRDELAVAPVIADLGALVPPVYDQTTSGGFAPYSTAQFPHGYGAGVCWAMGYYAKTYQENLQRNALVTTDPAGIISPYFLWANGGGNHFHFAGELLRGYGAPTLKDFPSADTVTSDVHFQEAAQFKELGYAPFFAHTPHVNFDTQRFASLWNNNVAPLIKRLAPPLDANGNQPPGDCVMLGIPVFLSFVNYKQDVYTVETIADERFLGFHAVCVTGCSDIKHAFRIVNSWGAGWGESGYAWLSYDFVRKYAIEAWRMSDSTAFGLDPTARTSIVGRTWYLWTKDYAITYVTKHGGRVDVTTDGIAITGGNDSDTLNIKRRKGVTWGETIPRIQTAGGFAKFYTQAPIAELTAAGNLGAVTASSCTVQSITARTIRSISMAARMNSTWPVLSQKLGSHPGGWYEQTGQSLGNCADTQIVETITSVTAPIKRSMTVHLSGVRLRGLFSSANTSLRLISKRIVPTGIPPFITFCEATSDCIISVLGTLSVSGAGSAIHCGEIQCGSLKNVSLSGLRWGTQLRAYRTQDVIKYADYLRADWVVAEMRSYTGIQTMLVTGGDIAFSTMTCNGGVKALQARYAKWTQADGATSYTGGRLGAIDRPTTAAILAAGYGQESNAPLASIQLLRGDLGVAGQFIAGAHANGQPDFAGIIKTIRVLPKAPGLLPKPLIQGDAYTNSNSIINFKGDTSPTGHFTEHHQ
ncbi:MAG: hypothetical protein NTX50_18045 [Candidatus Sumerlaeota bacterium]|nr:hypothetical protein [Candidatus Sumerlaeota bacterium]